MTALPLPNCRAIHRDVRGRYVVCAIASLLSGFIQR